MLSIDLNPSKPSFPIDLTDDNDVPNDAQMDEYVYGEGSACGNIIIPFQS